ncbi:probable oxidoreductase, LLM family [Seinonella peptonophila]|uniref:Probable oxidoreductase, LLM family n=1 Tax=Seinonella peptonophila TaxID=112248 RepID=A0A1M4Y5L2_9BACL|nr:LLM class flavin-dependent oxidoreductase [Seinonella peptonophila]SHF01051.1 probable oxidoreductase, LLM family [Seinonella peptonophila]
MELGISTFVETTPDPVTGEKMPHDQRIREVIKEIRLADQVGLDIYGVGEHHRADYAASAPAMILAGAATQTKRIRLTSAVTVLSSDDPVRVFQDFATLDGISNGRAELMVGRGSFIESFPLFGYDLNDYDQLFAEKLELLLAINRSETVNWSGKHRPAIDHLPIYPRPVQDQLPIWIASGGTRSSAIRAGELGLPLVLAIIGGNPEHFAPIVEQYKRAAVQAGHDLMNLPIASHSHGFVWNDSEEAADLFFPSTQASLNIIGKERGWSFYSRESFDSARQFNGALYVGDPQTVAEKIIHLRKTVGMTRFFLHMPVGTMPHDQVMTAIELYGTKVAPIVRREIAQWEKNQAK